MEKELTLGAILLRQQSRVPGRLQFGDRQIDRGVRTVARVAIGGGVRALLGAEASGDGTKAERAAAGPGQVALCCHVAGVRRRLGGCIRQPRPNPTPRRWTAGPPVLFPVPVPAGRYALNCLVTTRTRRGD